MNVNISENPFGKDGGIKSPDKWAKKKISRCYYFQVFFPENSLSNVNECTFQLATKLLYEALCDCVPRDTN
jgi:hypothetical protein